jgi:hypothetical protein
MLTLVDNAKRPFTYLLNYFVLGCVLVPLSWYRCDLIAIENQLPTVS